MSRRKQANPAKLGDADTTADAMDDDDTSLQIKEKAKPVNGESAESMGPCKSEISDCKQADQNEIKSEKDEELDENDDTDVELRNLAEPGEDDPEDIDEDDASIILLNGQGSSPSCSEQSSPGSCQSSTLSDVPDGDEPYTIGATATTPYECSICKRAFARSSVLNKHVQTHTEQLQFSCFYCRRLFKHKRSRDRHTKLHTGDKKYKCLHCDSAFARSDHLKIHMKTHDNKKPHQCELCKRGYNTAAALASHQQHHSKKERHCGSSASHTSAFSTPSPGNFRCLQCSESFSKADLLQTHLLSNHKTTQPPQQNQLLEPVLSNVLKSSLEMPKIACMYCGKDFSSMNQMYHHINTEHSAIFNNPHSVNYTPLTSPGANNLSPKLTKQNTSPLYACDRCTMKFDSPHSLKEHSENIHWKPALPINFGAHLKDYPYELLQNSEKKYASLQEKPTDLSRKRRLEESNEQKQEKRKSDETSAAKKTAPSSAVSPYDTNDKPCICSYCYVQLPNFKSFLTHMESHVSVNASAVANANTLIGYCPICGEPGRDPIEFGNHIFQHTVTNVSGQCCHQCKKSFEHLEQLQKHLMEVHSQTIFKCIICGDIFESQLAIQMHFNSKHCHECKHYRCNFCPEQYFHGRLTAELHVSMKHGNHIPSMSTTKQSYSNFTEHETRLTYPTFQCPLCQKTFKDEYLQYIHILKEHNDGREGENYLLEVSALSQLHIPPRSPSFPYKSLSPQDGSKTDLKLMNCYTCDICNRSDMNSEAELSAHKKLHHSKTKSGSVSLQCAYCSEHCKSRSDLENHMKTHQVTCGKGKHKCNICDEIFSSAITLADHKLTHCKIVAGNSCTQCKTILVDEQCFYTHQLQHSNTSVCKSNSQISLPANCIVCCQTLQTDVEIKLHAKFHLRHLLQKEYLCTVCNKIFDSNTKLEKNTIENGISVFICKDCANTSGNASYQVTQIDSNIKQYTCMQCPLTFEKEEDFQAHAAMHILNEGTSLDCHLCRNVLPSPLKLQAHLIEHNFMGIGQFRCYVCSSVFTTASGLQSHIVAHGLSHRPYECSECKMKFFFETELDNHRFSHILPAQKGPYANPDNYYENVTAEKLYKICNYCSGLYIETFAEHLEVCPCRVEIKKESTNIDETEKSKQSDCYTKNHLDETVTNETESKFEQQL